MPATQKIMRGEPDMARKLFCEISPLAYRISVEKEIILRNIRNAFSVVRFSGQKNEELLPVAVIKHRSLIRRKLHNVDQNLQENKAKTLSIASPLVSHIMIYPGETFSFWKLIGRPSYKKGYLDGVTITKGRAHPGVGGGICQLSNLIHWMILHTDLDITEHWHHDSMDLFPDFKRQIPFGTGTSVSFNNLDYRFKNNTNRIYQLIIYTTQEYLCGEIRATESLPIKIHIREEESYFYEKDGEMYRHNKIYRRVVDKITGNTMEDKLLMEHNAQVMYDWNLIDSDRIITSRAIACT